MKPTFNKEYRKKAVRNKLLIFEDIKIRGRKKMFDRRSFRVVFLDFHNVTTPLTMTVQPGSERALSPRAGGSPQEMSSSNEKNRIFLRENIRCINIKKI